MKQALSPVIFRILRLDHARRYCGDAPHVEFHAQDIRSGIPVHDVQVCLVSDVLYYLSPREISSFAIELASRMNSSGPMVLRTNGTNATAN